VQTNVTYSRHTLTYANVPCRRSAAVRPPQLTIVENANGNGNAKTCAQQPHQQFIHMPWIMEASRGRRPCRYRSTEVKTNAKAMSLLSSSGDDISSDKINVGKVNSNNYGNACTGRNIFKKFGMSTFENIFK